MKVQQSAIIRVFLTAVLAVLVVLVVLAVGCGGPRGGGRAGQAWPEIVEGGAIFHYVDRDARSVHLVGDFNNWTPRADPMVDSDGDGEWTLFYSLLPGTYEYKFVVDNKRWIPDPKNPNRNPDGFDGWNSVVHITGRRR